MRTITARTRRTVGAVFWMYSGRLIGLAWAILLTHELGIADFGRYAVALAVSTLIAVPLDHYFVVRAPRVPDEVFLSERTTRVLVASVLLALGAVAMGGNLLSGFLIARAGAEIAFNAVKSYRIRHGFPNRANRLDTSRQIFSITLAVSYLLIAPHPTLGRTCFAYLVGYSPAIVVALWEMLGHRPTRPVFDSHTRAIIGESFAASAFAQADVILVGVAATNSVAGYYAFGTQAAWALAGIGQVYSYTFHDSLRASGGKVSSGPPLRMTTLLSLATAVMAIGMAIILAIIGQPHELWTMFLVMAPVAALRTFSAIFTTVLVLQRRDMFRLMTTIVALTVKLGLVLVLAHYGSVAVALAALAGEVVMATAYRTAVARSVGRPPEDPNA